MDWGQIEKFVGYGRVDAPVVFLGMEEGQSKLSSLAADLRHRSTFDPTMDLQEAHRGIDGTARYFDAVRGTIQRTWRPMCHVMIRQQSPGAVPNTRSRLSYQAIHLGRIHGDTLLMELLPYPKRTAVDWPEIYRRRYATRSLYEQEMLPKRIDLLSRVLARHPRKFIICYGKGNWIKYKQLVKAAFKVDPREWMPAMPFRGAHGALTVVAGDTRIILVKHFCCSAFNTDAQLEHFSNIALA